MNPTRVDLPEWGCVVFVVGDRLYAAPLSGQEDATLIPIDLVCECFLRDVNHALATDFDLIEFPYVWCEGHDNFKRLP